jgi:hypothetical protein
MKQQYLEFKVRFPLLPGVKERDVRLYIKEALRGWCGQSYEESDWWRELQDHVRQIKVTVLGRKSKWKK